MAAGRLPTLRSLRARSAEIRAETIGGVFEEAVWPTVFSGERLGDHASQHFVRFDATDHGLVLEREVQLEPFWLHLPERGRGGAVVDVPQVHPHPLEQTETACSWASWSAPHRPVVSGSLSQVLGRSDAHRWLHEFDREPSLADERSLARRLRGMASTRSAAIRNVQRERRFVCVGYAELHAVAHTLAHHWLEDHPHRPWPREPELVTSVYEAVDAGLAQIVDDPSMNVVVLATQGFRPANSSSPVLEELLVRAGLSVLPESIGDGGRRHLDPMDLLRRWLPATLRERLATRLLPQSAQQALMAQQFRSHLDWTATRAFALPSWTTGYVRINLEGREALGIVPPDAYEPLLDEVEQLLVELRRADSGAPMVRNVIRMRRNFPGPRADDLPDLAVEWAPDVPVRRVTHPALGTWEAEVDYHRYRWSDHHGRAVGWLSGPGVKANQEPTVVDIHGAAATFLRLLDVRPPSNLAQAWDEVLA